MKKYLLILLLATFFSSPAMAVTDWWATQNVNTIENMSTPPDLIDVNIKPNTISLTAIIMRIYTIPTVILHAAPIKNGTFANQAAYFIRIMQMIGTSIVTLMFFVAFIKLYSFQIVDNKMSSAIRILVKTTLYYMMIFLAPILVLSVVTIIYHLYKTTTDIFGVIDPTDQIYNCITLYFTILYKFVTASFSEAGPAGMNGTTGMIASIVKVAQKAEFLGTAVTGGMATLLPTVIMVLSSIPYLLEGFVVTILLTMILITLIAFAIGILFSAVYSMMLTLMFLPIFLGLDIADYDEPLEHATTNIITPLFIPIVMYLMLLLPIKILHVVLDPYYQSLVTVDAEISKQYPNIISVWPSALHMAQITHTQFITTFVDILTSLAFLFVMISMLKSLPDITHKIFGGTIAKMSTAGAGVVAGVLGTVAGFGAAGLIRGGGAALGAAADSSRGQALQNKVAGLLPGGGGNSGGSTGIFGQTAGLTQPPITMPQPQTSSSLLNHHGQPLQLPINQSIPTNTPATGNTAPKPPTNLGSKINNFSSKASKMAITTGHGAGQVSQAAIDGDHGTVANVVRRKIDKIQKIKNPKQ